VARLQTYRYTVARHSAYGEGARPAFARALQPAIIETTEEVALVTRAGGVLFDSFEAAEAYCQDEQYPGPLMFPDAPGSFSPTELRGHALYLPVPRLQYLSRPEAA
jgi:hypothetical protein